MRWLALLLGLWPALAAAQESTRTRELIGHVGGRAALLRLYVTALPDGAARLTGDYILLPTLLQRFVEGERSKQLGVTFLREGDSPILYGRPPLATLQGRWSDGVLKGARYGPAGQVREQFEFSERFRSMERYSASARCTLEDGRYQATLEFDIESGTLKRLEWRSRVAPGGHTCAVSGLAQQPFEGGLRFARGSCAVTLRDLGEFVRIAAEGCSELCGSEAYLEPVLVDSRGNCTLLRPQAR